MTKNAKPALEPGSVPLSPRHDTFRKPYQKPLLVEWGSIVELTGGPLQDIQDDDFSGSNGS